MTLAYEGATTAFEHHAKGNLPECERGASVRPTHPVLHPRQLTGITSPLYCSSMKAFVSSEVSNS